MDVPRATELVGDSQEGGGPLAALAAAMGSPTQRETAPGHDQDVDQGQAAPAGLGLPPGDEAAPGGAPAAAAPPLQPAAQAFASLCTCLGAAPHPDLVRSLNSLSAEAFTELTPGRRPGKGAAPERSLRALCRGLDV